MIEIMVYGLFAIGCMLLTVGGVMALFGLFCLILSKLDNL